ncbi:MAG: alpha-galactosidase [Actinomycetaceae bacterium]|nr:alpha-galactosidase [Actinomycetaceae bacterium]
MTALPEIVHLRSENTSLLIETRDVPVVTYWGPSLGEVPDEVLADLVANGDMTIPSGTTDGMLRVGIVPQEADGWLGEPGIQLTRAGRLIPVRLRVCEVVTGGAQDQPWEGSGPEATDVASWTQVRMRDEAVGVEVVVEVQLSVSGIVRVRTITDNCGEAGLGIVRVIPALPVPNHLTCVLDQAGHHLRERATFTHDLTVGVHRRSTRGARNHNASTIIGVCEDGTTNRSGRVYYAHLEWSGNTDTWVERTPFGHTLLAGGELLMPGEVVLSEGESYVSPWFDATWGEGLDEAAARFHAYIRSFAAHPRRPRPVTLNAWEAVYFDHSLDNLAPLVERAAQIGVERFVLDDGWFGSRRDDTSGLGDWQVSEQVWPDGLGPLADLIHERGMEFGLWFEPEMVNPDSDLARAHPEWILGPSDRDPLACRHQLVLNLALPQVRDYLFDAISRVVEDAGVDYIKWDYNRDLLEPFDRCTAGGYAVHRQTLATYELLDRLHARFPDLEIESCAGGGGRVDLAIMRRAQRVWGSDCIDPLERQTIQAGTSLLLPGELVGSHIASPTSHTTGRTQALQTRAINALPFHLGIEWDIRQADEEALAELAEWIAYHRRNRELFHSGTHVTGLQADDSLRVSGLVDEGASRAIYTLFQTRTSVSRPLGLLTLPGLDPNATYRVHVPEVARNHHTAEYPHNGHGSSCVIAAPRWWREGLVAPGALLSEYGVAAPVLNPEQAVVVEVERLD